MKEYSLGTIPFPQAHTAENIAATLKQQLSSILGDDDVGATWYPVVTTDSAADIRAALRSLDGWSWMKCCCLQTFTFSSEVAPTMPSMT